MKNKSSLSELLQNKKSFFFLGIGGVSMSALAFAVQKIGCRVAGYDAATTATTERLKKEGIPVYCDFSEAYYQDTDAVIYTGAIHEDDPVLAYPLSRQIPVFKRPLLLGELMKRTKNPIGVAGTHGKSTTTGMLSSVFLADESRDPTIMIGAELPMINGTWRLGTGDDFLFEACEYQDSFLDFFPHLAIVLNVEHDHADYFPHLEDVIRSFVKFCDLAEEGRAIINLDSPAAKCVADRTKAPVFAFSAEQKGDLWCENVTSENGFYRFDIVTKKGVYTSCRLGVPGFHNVSNALAAAAAAYVSNVPGDAVKRGLEAFRGVKRRFEYRGVCGEMQVFDDYAHHPDEIRATLSSAKNLGYEKITVVFQSHTYSRTKAYWKDFIDALSLADEVIHMDIYPAREAPIEGVTAEAMAVQSPNGRYLGSADQIAQYLIRSREKGLLIVMGAGDVVNLTDRILSDGKTV